jgi:hypothetical protein
MESRVLISARRFKDMPITATDKEIEPLRQIDTKPRQFQTAEFSGHPDQPILFGAENGFGQPDDDNGQAGQEHNPPRE